MSRFLKEAKPKRKLHKKYKEARVGLSEAEMKKPVKGTKKQARQGKLRTRYTPNPDSKIDRFLSSFASRKDIDLIINSADRAAGSGLNARNHSGNQARDLGKLSNPKLFGTDKFGHIDKKARKKALVKDMAMEAAIIGLRVGDEEGTYSPHIHIDQNKGKPYFSIGMKGREGRGSGDIADHAALGLLMRSEMKSEGMGRLEKVSNKLQGIETSDPFNKDLTLKTKPGPDKLPGGKRKK